MPQEGLVPLASPKALGAVAEGGAYVNNAKVPDEQWVPREGDLLDGRWLVVRRGKRNLAGVLVER